MELNGVSEVKIPCAVVLSPRLPVYSRHLCKCRRKWTSLAIEVEKWLALFFIKCIPKKLMHYGGTIGNILHRDAAEFGWQNVANGKHDWPTMQTLIGNYIRSLNFSYKVQLRSANVTYLDGLAQFVDPHTIEWKVDGWIFSKRMPTEVWSMS